MTDILTSDMTSEEQEQDVKKVLERARLERLRTWMWRCAPIWAGGDVIRFTVQPRKESNNNFYLHDVTPPVDCVVDWGDGTRDEFTEETKNMTLEHFYADTTPRTVTITGALGGLWNEQERSIYSVISVDRISSQSLVTLKNTFHSMSSLKKLPARIDAPNLVNCDNAFYGCKSIESPLPPLWKTNPKASHVNTFTKSIPPSLNLWTKYGKACPHALCAEGSSMYEFLEREAAEGFPSTGCRLNTNTDPLKFKSGNCRDYSKSTRCSAATCKRKTNDMGDASSTNYACVKCLVTRMNCYTGPYPNGDCPLPNEEVAHPSWAEARAAGWL